MRRQCGGGRGCGGGRVSAGGAHLEGHGGESAEAHELRDVDCDRDAARQQQADERWHVELVRQDPLVAHREVHKRPDEQQRPPLQQCGVLISRSQERTPASCVAVTGADSETSRTAAEYRGVLFRREAMEGASLTGRWRAQLRVHDA